MQINNPFEDITERLSRIEHCLLDLKQVTRETNSQLQPDVLDISQTAELLKLSTATIYGLTHRHLLPFSKKGKKLYFLRSELLTWLNSGRRKTQAEIEQETDVYLKKR